LNRWILTLLAGSVAVAPVVAKPAAKASGQASAKSKQSAASKKAKPASKTPKPAAKPDASGEKLVPTVSFNPSAPKPTVKVAVEPGHDNEKPAAASTTDPAPGVPTDFGTETEEKAYQKDVDSSLADIQDLLTGALKKKAEKPKTGLSGVIALQPQIEKALNDDRLAEEDRQNLKALVQERDTALYMLGASLVAQKKDYAAGGYLRFLAKSAAPGTPMREAAAQQLAQLGQHP